MSGAREFCRSTIADPKAGDLQWALSAYFLNERGRDADARMLRAMRSVDLQELEMSAPLLTDVGRPAFLGTSDVKWCMRLWLRAFFFATAGERKGHGGVEGGSRMSHECREAHERFFFEFARKKSVYAKALPEYLWCIENSENHDIMNMANAFLCTQALVNRPEYAEADMPDGRSLRDHHEAWTGYFIRYCAERATRGLFVEVASPGYGGWMLPDLINVAEFAESSVLRRAMKMLLDVTWADWAIDQLSGIRGGGKTRAYPGRHSLRGVDSWTEMARWVFQVGTFEADAPGYPNSGNSPDNVDGARPRQWEYVAATTSYRVPPIVSALAASPEGRGRYVYTSVRPAKLTSVPKDHLGAQKVAEIAESRPALAPGMWYDMDRDDPHLLRYSYCTPNYILGSLCIDPTYGVAFRVDEYLDYAPRDNYAAISAQNQWHGIIFDTGPDMRVVPQCEPERHGPNSVTFNQFVTCQHQNVLLLQKNRNARCAGRTRACFASKLVPKLLIESDRVYLREGLSYLAVVVLPRLEDPSLRGFIWRQENNLEPRDEYAPIAFVSGSKDTHPTLQEFAESVRAHQFTVAGGILDYRFTDTDLRPVTMTMSLETAKAPVINGNALRYRWDKAFDSPFLRAELGGSTVEISYRGDREVLDFRLDNDG